MYDYGTCHNCGERLQARHVKQEFWIKGRLILVEGVPAGVCPQCGERVVRAAVGRSVLDLVSDARRRRNARTVRIPVLRFAKKIA
jgi:YgiT-type zinc finger domain-containing protein